VDMQAHAHHPHSEMEASILQAIVLDAVREVVWPLVVLTPTAQLWLR